MGTTHRGCVNSAPCIDQWVRRRPSNPSGIDVVETSGRLVAQIGKHPTSFGFEVSSLLTRDALVHYLENKGWIEVLRRMMNGDELAENRSRHANSSTDGGPMKVPLSHSIGMFDDWVVWPQICRAGRPTACFAIRSRSLAPVEDIEHLA